MTIKYGMKDTQFSNVHGLAFKVKTHI